VDLETLLERHGIEFRPAGRSGWANLYCPHCQTTSGKWHLGINFQSLACNCWKCGRHSLYETLTLLDVPAKAIRSVTKTRGSIRSEKDLQDGRGILKLPRHGELLKVHRNYLKRRRFDPDELERLWGIKGIRFHTKMAYRILIPIHYQGRIVSWTTRATNSNDSMKYLSAAPEEEILNHKTIIYGEDYCRHSVIIHEGPTDVWATGPGATASFGTSFVPAQVARYAKYPVRVVCFDRGPEAQTRAKELCKQLDVFRGRTYNVELETGDDPAEADPQEIEELRSKFL